MKKYIYSYRNRKLGVYQDAFTARDEPDKMRELVTRAISIGAYKPEDHIEELSLYCLGSYDDEKAEIEPNNKCLLDLDEIYLRSKPNERQNGKKD